MQTGYGRGVPSTLSLRAVYVAPDREPHWGAQVFRLPTVDIVETLGYHSWVPWLLPDGEPTTPLTLAEVTAANPTDGALPWTQHPLYDAATGAAPRHVHAARVAHLMRTHRPTPDQTRDLPDLVILHETLTMLDGCHRLLAAHLRGERDILVCLDGDTDEAAIHAALGLP